MSRWRINRTFSGRFRVQWYNGRGTYFEVYGPWWKVPYMVYEIWRTSRRYP